MTQTGVHTWDLQIDYIRCPQCGLIIESREKGTLRKGNYEKDIKCSRCQNSFVDIHPKNTKAEVNQE